MKNLNEIIEKFNIFEPEDDSANDEDCIIERVTSIKPPGKGDSGMAEER